MQLMQIISELLTNMTGALEKYKVAVRVNKMGGQRMLLRGSDISTGI